MSYCKKNWIYCHPVSSKYALAVCINAVTFRVMGLSKRNDFRVSFDIVYKQNLVIWLHSFAFDNYSLIYIQVFFFSKNYQNEFLWVLRAKFEISSEIFFSFDDAILEIIGFEAELHHQKICFPKITSGCKDANHFDTIMKAIGNLTEIEKWLKNVWISSLLKLSFYLVFLVRNFIFKNFI